MIVLNLIIRKKGHFYLMLDQKIWELSQEFLF